MNWRDQNSFLWVNRKFAVISYLNSVNGFQLLQLEQEIVIQINRHASH